MGRKAIDKKYRKFVSEEDGFKRYCLIESLDDDEKDQLLMAISFNLIPSYQRQTDTLVDLDERYEVVFSNHTHVEERRTVLADELQILLDTKHSNDYIVFVFNSSGDLLYRSEYGRIVFNHLSTTNQTESDERVYVS